MSKTELMIRSVRKIASELNNLLSIILTPDTSTCACKGGKDAMNYCDACFGASMGDCPGCSHAGEKEKEDD